MGPQLTPPSSLRTAPRQILLPYRYGEHRWEDYLLDAQALYYAGTTETIASVDRVEQAVRTSAERADDYHIALLGILEEHGELLQDVSQHLEAVAGVLDRGFTTLQREMQLQQGLLREVTSELRRIAEALQNPLAVRANEHLRLGETFAESGLYPEALEAFLAAASLQPVDSFLQMRLGELHYRVATSERPIDFAVARRHFEWSVRYLAALPRSAHPVARMALQSAAQFAFVEASEASRRGDFTEEAACLARANELLTRGGFAADESLVLATRVSARRGDTQQALSHARTLADRSRAWVTVLREDPDFAAIREAVAALPDDLKRDPGPQSASAYRLLEEARAVVVSAGPLEQAVGQQPTLATAIDRIERAFESGLLSSWQCGAQVKRSVSRGCSALSEEGRRRAAAFGKDAASVDFEAAVLEGRRKSVPTLAELLPICFVVSLAVYLVSIPIWFKALNGSDSFFGAAVFGTVGTANLVVCMYWLINRAVTRRHNDVIAAQVTATREEAKRRAGQSRHMVAMVESMDERAAEFARVSTD